MSRGFPLRKAADGDTFAPSALFPGNVTGPGRYDGRERGERMAALRERGGRTAWPGQTVAAGLGMLGAVFLLPLLFLPPSDSPPSRASQPAEVLPVPTVTRPEPTPVPGWDEGGTLRVQTVEGTVEEMTVREYLWGVVAAEMPASFHQEALKAQAVCARTYCVYRRGRGEDKHPGADVCSDSTCCQARLTREQAMERWGEDGAQYADKVTQAVDDTDGLLCLYEGEPIDALFFSSTEGRTSNAEQVWGESLPYLVSVDSPEGDEVPGWKTVVTYPASEVERRILAEYPGADLSGPEESWFGASQTDESGTVVRITVGGVSLTGLQARTLFGLRSPRFTVEPGESGFTFHVTGYGHGVGMSQYGAHALAAEGKTFRQILEWYYTGITVAGWEGA